MALRVVDAARGLAAAHGHDQPGVVERLDPREGGPDTRDDATEMHHRQLMNASVDQSREMARVDGVEVFGRERNHAPCVVDERYLQPRARPTQPSHQSRPCTNIQPGRPTRGRPVVGQH
jgi:hypothetical protein